jgi:hypothetical protein
MEMGYDLALKKYTAMFLPWFQLKASTYFLPATLNKCSRIQMPAKHGTVTLHRMFALLAYSTDRTNKK